MTVCEFKVKHEIMEQVKEFVYLGSSMFERNRKCYKDI